MPTKLAAIAAGAVVFTGLGVGTATTASATAPPACGCYGKVQSIPGNRRIPGDIATQ
ncbi:hypothetical protein ACGF12_07530 [Kitasatospora sp. NPDC048296]|uniref:hypothetical protein n=1 Tax=Kitasatospora sp. NPDC048296 TaxID=3364048 RepID=UPI003722C3D8